MLCLKLLVAQEGSREWRSVHSCCFEPKTRALRKKHRSAFQPINIKLYEDMENGETFKMPRGLTRDPPHNVKKTAKTAAHSLQAPEESSLASSSAQNRIKN